MADKEPTRTTGAEGLKVQVSLWDCSPGSTRTAQTLFVPAGSTVDDLLGHLSSRLGRDLRQEALNPGRFLLLINGAYCALPQHLQRTVEEGDRLELVPPLSGG